MNKRDMAGGIIPPEPMTVERLERIAAILAGAEYLAATVQALVVSERRRAAIGCQWSGDLPDTLTMALGDYMSAAKRGMPDLEDALYAMAPDRADTATGGAR